MDIRIDYSRFTGTQSEEVVRQNDPRRELRSQTEKERSPDYFQKTREREGDSSWSGGSWGGRSR